MYRVDIVEWWIVPGMHPLLHRVTARGLSSGSPLLTTRLSPSISHILVVDRGAFTTPLGILGQAVECLLLAAQILAAQMRGLIGQQSSHVYSIVH